MTDKADKLTRQTSDGIAAERILKDDLFNAVLEGMKKGNLENWRMCDPSDMATMSRCHTLDAFLTEFKDTFEEVAIRGENARKEMAKLAGVKEAA